MEPRLNLLALILNMFGGKPAHLLPSSVGQGIFKCFNFSRRTQQNVKTVEVDCTRTQTQTHTQSSKVDGVCCKAYRRRITVLADVLTPDFVVRLQGWSRWCTGTKQDTRETPNDGCIQTKLSGRRSSGSSLRQDRDWLKGRKQESSHLWAIYRCFCSMCVTVLTAKFVLTVVRTGSTGGSTGIGDPTLKVPAVKHNQLFIQVASERQRV